MEENKKRYSWFPKEEELYWRDLTLEAQKRIKLKVVIDKRTEENELPIACLMTEEKQFYCPCGEFIDEDTFEANGGLCDNCAKIKVEENEMSEM